MAILISIKPEYVAGILNRYKTIEIRKTRPNVKMPCKVYIYCSKKTMKDLCCYSLNSGNYKLMNKEEYDKDFAFSVNGSVVAEFTLKRIDAIEICDPDILINGKQCKQANLQKECQVSIDDIMSYIGYGDDHDGWGKDWDKGYLWHIDGLKIYDKPKELSGFSVGKAKIDCGYGNYNIYNKILKRPPQSWCYVEDAINN